jgi:hypothetical protein
VNQFLLLLIGTVAFKNVTIQHAASESNTKKA